MSNSANHIDTAILWTLLCSCVTSAVGQENADVQPTKLVHNKPFSATMDLDEEPIHGFVVSIPATARSMSVEVTDTPLLFDIFGQHEDSPEDFDHQRVSGTA